MDSNSEAMKTEAELMEWAITKGFSTPPVGQDTSPDYAVSIDDLRKLFKGQMLVPSGSVVLSLEDAKTLYSSGDRDKLILAQIAFESAIKLAEAKP